MWVHVCGWVEYIYECVCGRGGGVLRLYILLLWLYYCILYWDDHLVLFELYLK